ncbi:DNA cytosine methyltransferase [Sinisalibacter aestuarii]|uniref:DNA (cytosine-5-)-methyltransferase n=1 Tax=Sinisalibacter aestuarii TaxID=2949426 RepID=A0ABQ5LR60_9RHOB|nr:DNA cytosine methyltransferase [Sinisalibacter aestuarii]GKY87414.1 restriction endonuclease subunit M [Sinisalibacter aestuarii]
MARQFGIVDLFAGPGGLGEGFSAAGRETDTRMDIQLSIEKEPTEVQTLRLRAFLRSFGDRFPKEYYDHLNAGKPLPDWSELYPAQWKHAEDEARRLELGQPGVFEEITEVLDRTRESFHGDTILIGGPPCQAYSLVGRARNKGKICYVPEDDHRHFLYREYVNILDRLHPAMFVMENVKGMLSSKVGGGEIFQRVLDDLRSAGDGYTLFPLASPIAEDEPNARDFIVRAEQHGVPQARHRVFIVGIRTGLAIPAAGSILLEKVNSPVSVERAIFDLPDLRSGLSRGDDPDRWHQQVLAQAERILASNAVPEDVRRALASLKKNGLAQATSRIASSATARTADVPPRLRKWLSDKRLHRILHHETRGHIPDDLGRYLYASTHAIARNDFPRLDEFPDFLQPNHANKDSGKFKDRFRVQVKGRPSTTVTSHISKDGHYFIHPDPRQARSLTVREAARLQTFPDNYYFMGNRTQQYHQVGNAVPPYLASQIGRVVRDLLEQS